MQKTNTYDFGVGGALRWGNATTEHKPFYYILMAKRTIHQWMEQGTLL